MYIFFTVKCASKGTNLYKYNIIILIINPKEAAPVIMMLVFKCVYLLSIVNILTIEYFWFVDFFVVNKKSTHHLLLPPLSLLPLPTNIEQQQRRRRRRRSKNKNRQQSKKKRRRKRMWCGDDETDKKIWPSSSIVCFLTNRLRKTRSTMLKHKYLNDWLLIERNIYRYFIRRHKRHVWGDEDCARR